MILFTIVLSYTSVCTYRSPRRQFTLPGRKAGGQEVCRWATNGAGGRRGRASRRWRNGRSGKLEGRDGVRRDYSTKSRCSTCPLNRNIRANAALWLRCLLPWRSAALSAIPQNLAQRCSVASRVAESLDRHLFFCAIPSADRLELCVHDEFLGFFCVEVSWPCSPV